MYIFDLFFFYAKNMRTLFLVTLIMVQQENRTTKDHYLTFPEWFEDLSRNSSISEEVKWLSKGPNIVDRRFSAYVINGYKYIIKGCERKTQTTGVLVTSSVVKFKTMKDEYLEVENVTYYNWIIMGILSLCCSNAIGFKVNKMILG